MGWLDGVSIVRGPVVPPEAVLPLLVFGGSTRTSTIPGISIAGPSPEGTLWTPTLDLEYLVHGRPVSMDVVPVSPEGLPTPAVITRALAPRLGVQVLAVDSGLAHPLAVPHARLPHARPGGRIDVEQALPDGTAERVYGEAWELGYWAARGAGAVMLGETIPAGTTTAAAVMEALGAPGLSWVSSSSNVNPLDLKARVVRAALERARGCGGDPFCVVDRVGDPVHVAMAGAAAGALDAGAGVVLAGGTQMGAVLAVLRAAGVEGGEVMIATTPWIVRFSGEGIRGIAERYGAGLAYARVDFSGAPWRGLRMYEEGYVKEGVAAGGALYLAASLLGPGEAVRLVYEEYERLTGGGLVASKT